MNIKQTHMVIFLSLFVGFTFLACSDDETRAGCYMEEGLAIKETITDASGTIRGLGNVFCNSGIVIEPDIKVERRPLGSFFPCNITDEFSVDGARVIFSGYVYEGINDGDQCADFFEITNIAFIQ